jgi:nucleotide-binding universal stress UspA family protein
VVDAELPDELLVEALHSTPQQVTQTLREQTAERLRERAAALGAPCDVAVDVGAPYLAVTRFAQAAGARLIVVGDHGRHFLKDLFIGSTAEKIVRQGDRPVLVVKTATHEPYRRGLIPVDFSETSRHALETAATLVGPSAELHVLHIDDAGLEERLRAAGLAPEAIERYGREHMQRIEAQMRDFLSASALGETKATWRIEAGYPPTAILEAAQRLGCDLIALGTHGRSLIHRLLVGGVARHVMNEAPCDVLAVKPPLSQFAGTD